MGDTRRPSATAGVALRLTATVDFTGEGLPAETVQELFGWLGNTVAVAAAGDDYTPVDESTPGGDWPDDGQDADRGSLPPPPATTGPRHTAGKAASGQGGA